MKDLGFAVAPGSHTLVGVDRSVVCIGPKCQFLIFNQNVTCIETEQLSDTVACLYT